MQFTGNGYKTFICPSRIKGTDLVLLYIFKTRCNRPHVDCLVFDIVQLTVYVIKQSSGWQTSFECDPSLQDYNVEDMNK